MKHPLLAILGLLTISLSVEASDARYTIENGKIHTPTEVSEGAILLDEVSGRTWMLIQRGNATPVWLAIPFEANPQLSFDLVPNPLPTRGSAYTGDN